MPRVPVHDPDSAPSASQDTLKGLAETYGMTLNVFGEMAHAPALLNGFAALERQLVEHSSLSPRTRAALHLAVAAENECDYCQAAYTQEATSAGISQEETKAIRRGDLADELDPLLAVGRELVARRGWLTDGTWQQALDAGYDEQELLEVYAEALRTTMTNWFNHAVGTELDLPPAPPTDR